MILTNSTRAFLYLGNGDGTFAAEQTLSEDIEGQFDLSDLDNDGDLDIVSGQGTGYKVHLNDGSGSFSMVDSGTFIATLSAEQGEQILVVGDVNGDGTFGDATTATNFSGEYGAFGDFNNDGVTDFLTGYDGVILQETTSGVEDLFEFTLSTLLGAREALPKFGNVIDNLSEQRGQIGAFQSRLSSALNVLNSTRENYAAADSRIADADVASESAQLIRLSILNEATAAVLAQANSQPEIALQLLE